MTVKTLNNMFGNTKIKNRVMEAIDAKIKEVQKKHDEELKELEMKFEADQVTLADKHVNSILSKII